VKSYYFRVASQIKFKNSLKKARWKYIEASWEDWYLLNTWIIAWRVCYKYNEQLFEAISLYEIIISFE
jgi:hypothetical protein